MAITIEIRNNGNSLASEDIPDRAVIRIQEAFPAATAALSAKAFLHALAPEARNMVKRILANSLSKSLATTGNATHVAFDAAYDADWS